MSLEIIFQWYHKNSVRLDVTWAFELDAISLKSKENKEKRTRRITLASFLRGGDQDSGDGGLNISGRHSPGGNAPDYS
jgi:hypothetical protein